MPFVKKAATAVAKVKGKMPAVKKAVAKVKAKSAKMMPPASSDFQDSGL